MKLGQWKQKRADYVVKDEEVDDLVNFLNGVALIAGIGSVDLDDPDPVYVGLTVDHRSGENPKASIAISQDPNETRNSIINQADDAMRRWYLEHNTEFVKSRRELGEEYDDGWEATVWHLTPDSFQNALDRVDKSVLEGIQVERP
jgi:hypothetical protein